MKNYEHQDRWLTEHRGDHHCGLLWEPGTGKSRAIIKDIDFLDGLSALNVLIIAPNMVHVNWIDQFKQHCDEFVENYIWHAWDSKKTKTKQHAKNICQFNMKSATSIITINYEAVLTQAFRDWEATWPTNKPLYIVLDESHRIGNPTSMISKYIHKLYHKANYRRILTGTPYTQTPFSVYSQIKWLHHSLMPFASYMAFKTYFAEWKDGFRYHKGVKIRYPELVKYKNLDKLEKIVGKSCTLLKAEDCLDLPDQLEIPVYFEMEKKQQLIYDLFKKECLIQLKANEKDVQISASNPMDMLNKMRQITGGFIYADKGTMVLAKENPRVELTKEIVAQSPGKVIIWVSYRAEAEMLEQVFDLTESVKIIGGLSLQEKECRLEDWRKNPKVKVLITMPSCLGEGLTLIESCCNIYYSQGPSLVQKVQSMKRTHRIGQDKKVFYYYLLAKNTVDINLHNVLLKKLELSDNLTRKELRTWIE